MSQRSRQNDKRAHLAHIDALLQEAISQWQPEQPRRWLAIDGRPGLPSSQFMKVSQVEIAAIDPDFNRGYRLYP
jgi:hypothetical protein